MIGLREIFENSDENGLSQTGMDVGVHLNDAMQTMIVFDVKMNQRTEMVFFAVYFRKLGLGRAPPFFIPVVTDTWRRSDLNARENRHYSAAGWLRFTRHVSARRRNTR